MEREQVFAIVNPHKTLLTQYILQALFTGPISPFVMLVLYFRYRSMRYRFDAHGVTKSYGVLVRREVHLTYGRIQDIHVSSGPIQRWLGLADLQIQTASGSAGAELVIEGLTEFEPVRDFLYTQMRGITDLTTHTPSPGGVSKGPSSDPLPAADPLPASDPITALLREIRDDLKASREALTASGKP